MQTDIIYIICVINKSNLYCSQRPSGGILSIINTSEFKKIIIIIKKLKDTKQKECIQFIKSKINLNGEEG